jgi:hypothetical protein
MVNDFAGAVLDLATQALTIVGVLLGALTTYATGFLVERSKDRRSLVTRWDERKLETYVAYIGRIRDVIYAAVLLYEVKEGLRSMEASETSLTSSLIEAERSRALTFEQLVMLGGPIAVDAAHELNRAVVAIDWQARGIVTGSLQEWQEFHVRAFQLINKFHGCARSDLGVLGELPSDHSKLTLNLPPDRLNQQ